MLSALFALSLAASGAQAALLRSTVREWFWLSSIAVGDYLYISGGEFYEPADDVLTMYYQSQTFVVDLTQSWTNQTLVSANSVAQPDGMLYVRQPLLFYDKARKKISQYGGWPYETTAFPSELWSFPAGSSAVDFKNETSPSTDGLSSSSPGPFAAAVAYTDSMFYSLGGNIVAPNALPDMTVLSGLVTRDFSAESWSNSTVNIPDQSKFRTQARAVFVPNFGGKGFFVVVGGEAPPTQDSSYETGTAMVDMSVITLYDIETGTWYTQTATGDIPPPRSEFCAVGSASSNGQYFEIFVYGGSTNTTFDLNHSDDEGYLNVYVLSLPAFQWFKSPSTTPVRRACHTCTVIGNRQMVSIGGRLPSSLQSLGAEPDPWGSGIGVFDMTAFEWVDHYDAAAAVYESPEPLKRFYASSYQVPDWSDPTLASIFAYTVTNTNSSSPNSTSSGGSSGSPSATSSSASSGSSSNIGPIVGGVVGGVVLIAAILGLAYWIGRRRRNRNRLASAIQDVNGYENGPVAHYTPVAEAEGSPPVFEVESKSRSELEGLSPKPQFIAELPVNDEHERGPDRDERET